MNLLNLNRKIQDKKLKEFRKKVESCAKEIDGVLFKYEIKIVPFIQMDSWGNSPLLKSINARYTFAPMTEDEIKLIKIKEENELKKQNEAENTESNNKVSS